MMNIAAEEVRLHRVFVILRGVGANAPTGTSSIQ